MEIDVKRLRELLAATGTPQSEVWCERGHTLYVAIKGVGDLTLFQYGEGEPQLYVGGEDDPINEPLADLIAESMNALPELLRVYEAWQAAPVAPITEQVSFPLGGRIPLNFDEPCFKTTHARIVTCDAEGRPVADSALTINHDEIDSRLIVEDNK